MEGRKVYALFLHSRCTVGTFFVHARRAAVTALIPTARCIDGALSLHGRCLGGVLREKNGPPRPFLKVDEVEDYPYHIGEVAFGC